MVDQEVFGCADLDGNTRCGVGEPLLPPPAQMSVGENVPIVVLTVIRNDGPFTPVDAEAETIVTWPSVCQIDEPSHLERIRNLPVGVDVTVKAPFTIRCNAPGQHTFSFDNTMDVDMLHVRDPDGGNNTVHTELTVTAS
jgi:hypothetical protein